MALKTTDRSHTADCTIAGLLPRTFFKYKGALYLKLTPGPNLAEPGGSFVNAYNFSDAAVWRIDSDADVLPVDVELTLTPYTGE